MSTGALYLNLWGEMAPLPSAALVRPAENPAGKPGEKKPRKPRTNPMLAKHGQLSPGQVCANCAHLDAGEYHNKRYLKCELWGYTHGPGSDWRGSWPACNRFEQRDPAAPAILATRKTVKVPCTHAGCKQMCWVSVWYANTTSYARHPAPDADRHGYEHVVKVVIAADGTITSSQHGW